MPPVGTSTRAQLHWLTGLRGLAAFYVLCSHIWYQIWPAVPPPYGYGRFPPDAVAAFTGWLYYGHFAVVVFIVLSGFCLMLRVMQDGGVLRGGASAFLKRRARRILPPYYLALALTLLLSAVFIGEPTNTQWDITLPVTAQGIFTHVFLLNDLLDATQINYVFWSIALEVHLYLLFPWLVLLCRRWGVAATTTVAGAAVYALVALLEILQVKEPPPAFIGLCACFAVGVAAASLAFGPASKDKRWQRVPWGLLGMLFLASLIVLCRQWEHAVAERRFAFLDACCAAGTVCFMLASCSMSGGGITRRWLEKRALVAVGRMSYSLYLVHAPLLQLLWQYGVRVSFQEDLDQFMALMLFGVPVVLGFAWLFFLLAERPFARFEEVRAEAVVRRAAGLSRCCKTGAAAIGRSRPRAGHLTRWHP